MFRRHSAKSATFRATVVHRRPSIRFSKTGVVYIGTMLFMGIAAINSQANLLFGMFGLMIGVLLVSGVISRWVLKRLTLARVLPDHGCVGHPMTITYQLTNAKRFWPSVSIVIAELDGSEAFTKQPQGYMLHAAARMSASVPVLVIPKRRGLHELDRYQLVTSFPFGFVKRAVTGRRKDMLLVHPPLGEVHPRLLAMCRSADLTGETVRPQPGGADEFYGVKEYRPGDNPRWIYWRRSARGGTLVSREMTRVSPPRLVLLVDTCVENRSLEEHAAVERCIAMAASLAAIALDQGLSVGLFVWSGQWQGTPAMRGKRHREDLLSILSRLPLNTGQRLADLLDKCHTVLRTGTTPVLFTPRDVQVGIVDDSRGGMIVVPADSPRAKGFFRFEPEVDFITCMPADQQPTIPNAQVREIK